MKDRIRLQPPSIHKTQTLDKDEEEVIIKHLHDACSILKSMNNDTETTKKRKRKNTYIGPIVNTSCMVGINAVTRGLEVDLQGYLQSPDDYVHTIELVLISGMKVPKILTSHLSETAHVGRVPFLLLPRTSSEALGSCFGMKRASCIAIRKGRKMTTGDVDELTQLRVFGRLLDYCQQKVGNSQYKFTPKVVLLPSKRRANPTTTVQDKLK